MKYITEKILAFMLLVMPLFIISCSDENDPEDYSPKLYLYSPLKQGMTAKSEVVQSPTAIIMPEDVIEFYVHLSKELSNDIVVTVVENPDLAHNHDSMAKVLPVGTVEFAENNVVIPAGKTISEKPIRVLLKQTPSINELEGVGLIALELTTNSGVEVLKGREACYWTISKQRRNIFAGATIGLTAYKSHEVTLTASTRQALLPRLHDNRPNTQWFCDSGAWLQAKFNGEMTVSAVAVWPYGLSGSYSGSPKAIELQISADATKWESLGTVEFPLPAGYDPLVLQLYSPIQTEYLRLIFHEGFSPTIRITEYAIYQ